MEVPVAVIADLDVILKRKVISPLVKQMSNDEEATAIVNQCDEVAKKIGAVSPVGAVKEVHTRLNALADAAPPSDETGTERLKEDLSELVDQLDRMKVLKRGGVGAYTDQPEIQAALQTVIDRCERFGLFLVPVGELEYWISDLMIDGPSKKRHKAEWAALAIERIRNTGRTDLDICKFLGRIAAHLKPKEKLDNDTA
jgi:hypothetical protein